MSNKPRKVRKSRARDVSKTRKISSLWGPIPNPASIVVKFCAAPNFILPVQRLFRPPPREGKPKIRPLSKLDTSGFPGAVLLVKYNIVIQNTT